MSTVQREPLTDALRSEIQPLLTEHHREIAHFPDIALKPDYERYRKMDAAGVLRIYTARDEGRLVGYQLATVAPALHYMDSVQAVADVLFVLPEYRGLTGARLISRPEQMLREEGAQVAYQRCKAAHNFGPLLESLGYRLIDLVYAKRLDHGRNTGNGR